MSTKKYRELGTFKVVTGSLDVSDPCYDVDVWCRGEIKRVAKGDWNARIEIGDEGRPSRLIIEHAATPDLRERRCTTRLRADIGVDSGQCGFFDTGFYLDNDSVPSELVEKCSFTGNHEPFYGACCALTLSDDGAGVIPYGVVSSSGYGDGSYICRYHRDKATGLVVKAEVIFID